MVSQRERLEDIQNYAETLEELKFNSKPHISTLTELARDYGKNRQGREVIEIIKKRIVNKETPITQKMPTLYLLDSILKNHPDNYKQHIEEILASVFEVTFSSGDEKIRMAMYKLRQTWTPWFQYKTLYDLDMRTKKLDKAWPVIENPSKSGSGSDLPTASKPKPPSDIKRQTSNIHVNPNFVARAPSVSEDSQNDDDEIKAMEEKIKEMQRKKVAKKAQIEKDRKRKELEALLEKERMELERVERELKETELPKISTSGSKSKDSSHSSTSTSSSSSSSKASTSKVPTSGNSNKKQHRDPRQRSDKKGSEELSKILKAKTETERQEAEKAEKEALKQRAQSRSPTRQSPTSTSGLGSGGGSTPPPPAQETLSRNARSGSTPPMPPSIREEVKKIKKARKAEKAEKEKLFTPDEPNKYKIPKKQNDPRKVQSQSPAKRPKNEDPNSRSSRERNLPINRDRGPKGPESRGPMPERGPTPDRNGPMHDRVHGPERGPMPPRGGPGSRGGSMPPGPSPWQNDAPRMPTEISQKMADENPEVLLNTVIPILIKENEDGKFNGQLDKATYENIRRKINELTGYAKNKMAERSRQGPGPSQMGGPGTGPRPDLVQGLPIMGPNVGPRGPGGPRAGPWMDGRGPGNGPQMPLPNRQPMPMPSHRDLRVVTNEEFSTVDPLRTLPIDDKDSFIRFYGEEGTVLIDSDLYDLKFGARDQALTCKVTFAVDMKRGPTEHDVIVHVPVGSLDHTEFRIDNEMHRVKIGAPTRELWIDGAWYSVFFDCRPVSIKIGSRSWDVFLEDGAAPIVDIGKVARKDLCLGAVHLFIDGHKWPDPVFLDYKPQLFDIVGKPHIFRFDDDFRSIVINSHKFPTNFGGQLPMVIYVGGVEHTVILGDLPRGVKEWIGQPMPTRDQVISTEPLTPPPMQAHRPPLEFSNPAGAPRVENPNFISLNSENPEGENSNGPIPNQIQPFKSKSPTPTPQISDNKPASPKSPKYNEVPPPAMSDSNPPKSENQPPPKLDFSKLNIDFALLANLLKPKEEKNPSNSGVIPGLDTVPSPTPAKPVKRSQDDKENNELLNSKENTTETEPAKKKIKWEPKIKKIEPVMLETRHTTIKERQEAVIERIFDPKAMQCKNCGVRYSPNDQRAYEQHLNWHFRMNKKNKENARKAQSRKWYLEQSNWIISDEIEDTDDGTAEDEETKDESNADIVPSVPALQSENPDEKETCPVCREQFTQEFKHDDGHDFDDNGGQWHLINAIRPDGPQGVAYHPQCYSDKGNISMEIGEDTPKPVKPEISVKVEPIPMEVEPSEKPSENPVVDPSGTSDEPMKEEVKTEPTEDIVEEESMEVTPKPEPPELSDETSHQGQSQTSQESSEVPDVKVEAPEAMAEVNESNDENNTSLGNLTADSTGMLDAPSFPSVGIKVNITSQASAPGSPSSKPSDHEADTSISENQKIKSENEEENSVKKEPEPESEFDVDAIIQEKSNDDIEDPFRNKPKLRGKNMTIFPPKVDDERQEASLCSIM